MRKLSLSKTVYPKDKNSNSKPLFRPIGRKTKEIERRVAGNESSQLLARRRDYYNAITFFLRQGFVTGKMYNIIIS